MKKTLLILFAMAVAAMPLLDMAFSVFDTMSTFEEVSIEAYRPL